MTQIDSDLFCIGCGYNLRHAPSEGICSECGVAIERSINGDQLNRADPRWLAKLARGMRLILNAAVVLGVAMIVSMLTLPQGAEKWFNVFGGVGFVVLEGVGDWMVMSPEKRWNVRLMLVRGVLVFFLLAMGMGMAWQLSDVLGHPWPGGMWLTRLTQSALCAMLINKACVFLRGREIARRGFAPSLRWQCTLMVLIQVVLVPALLIQLLEIGAAGVSFPRGLGRLIEYVLQAGFLVTVTWGTGVVWMMRRCVLRAITR